MPSAPEAGRHANEPDEPVPAPAARMPATRSRRLRRVRRWYRRTPLSEIVTTFAVLALLLAAAATVAYFLVST